MNEGTADGLAVVGLKVVGVAVEGAAVGAVDGARVGYAVSVGDRGFRVGVWVGANTLT